MKEHQKKEMKDIIYRLQQIAELSGLHLFFQDVDISVDPNIKNKIIIKGKKRVPTDCSMGTGA